MKFTAEEQAMMDGRYGVGTQLAMRVLAAIGEAYDAPYMVPVTRTHVALSNQEADLWFAEKLVEGGAKCKIRPTVNPSFNWKEFHTITTLDNEDEAIVKRTHVAYNKLGAIMTYDCTPYLERNVPRFGEILSFSESSATPFVNSVYGARSNRESAQSALCSAITGVTPYYGFLLRENRAGNVLVHIEADMKDDFDYQMLGYLVPRKTGFAVPVFEGIMNPSKEALMNLGAQLNTGGNVALYHIIGFTPEARTLEEAFQGKQPQREVTVTRAELTAMREEISAPAGKIDFALYGCPHFTIDQVAVIAGLVKDKTLAVPLFIMTSSLTRNLAQKMGYMEILRQAGGRIVEDTCMDQPCWKFLYGKKGITDSPKCAYYTKRREMQFVIAPLEASVKAALKGRY
jgi:cis-L-3-hydroxyproline dehydratase